MEDYLVGWMVGVDNPGKTIRVKMTDLQLVKLGRVFQRLVKSGDVDWWIIEQIPTRTMTFEQFLKKAGHPVSDDFEFHGA